MKRVTINGVDTAYKEAGAGQDMILIHGRGFRKEGMDELFDHFKDRYHVISYDVRCHGDSQTSDSFSLDECADDLTALTETLRLSEPVVIGFSMGSYIALLAAEKRPGLFSKLVLIGTKGKESRTAGEIGAEPDPVRRALLSYDLFPELSRVQVPTLVMTGENDTVNPPDKCRAVAEGLPDARCDIIPNAGHIAWFDNKDRVIESLDEFLEGEQ